MATHSSIFTWRIQRSLAGTVHGVSALNTTEATKHTRLQELFKIILTKFSANNSPHMHRTTSVSSLIFFFAFVYSSNSSSEGLRDLLRFTDFVKGAEEIQRHTLSLKLMGKMQDLKFLIFGICNNSQVLKAKMAHREKFWFHSIPPVLPSAHSLAVHTTSIYCSYKQKQM